jgi:anti-anti-sigma factor
VPDCSNTPFRCERRSDGDRQHVVAIGEIDLETGPYLTGVIRAAQAQAAHVVLHLGQTTFMDAGGARILLAAHARTRATAATFAIAGATAPVERLLALVGANIKTTAQLPPQAKERVTVRAPASPTGLRSAAPAPSPFKCRDGSAAGGFDGTGTANAPTRSD